LNQALTDSLEMAFESAAKVKFAIKNAETGYEETVASDIAY